MELYQVVIKSRRFHNTVDQTFFDNYNTARTEMHRWADAEGDRNNYYFLLTQRVETNKQISNIVLDRRLPNA